MPYASKWEQQERQRERERKGDILRRGKVKLSLYLTN
jgi:hypothetical protein